MNSQLASLLLLLLLTLGLSQIIDLTGQYCSFDKFKVDFGRQYDSEDIENYRRDVFMQNLAKIDAINKDSSNTYTAGVNQFSDMLDSEFAAKLLTLKAPSNKLQTNNNYDVSVNIDWVRKGKVTPVKDQGFCGSSWAFASVAAIESILMISRYVPSPDLSEQEVMDCAVATGGCNGGWTGVGLQYVKTMGISSEEDYPSTNSNQFCQGRTAIFKISGVKETPGCFSLFYAVGKSPVTVAIDATNWAVYESGVFNRCGSVPNHGVVVVGVT